MMRTGMRTFWAPVQPVLPRVLVVEVAPILALIGLCLVLTAAAGTVVSYTDATARALHDPATYIGGVLGGGETSGGVR